MKRTFLMTGLAVLTLAFFMTGCNSMKKLQKEVIETAVVGYVNPEQLESVNGVVNFNYTINFAPKQFDKKMILKITPKIQYGSQMMNLQPMFLQGENAVSYTHLDVYKRQGLNRIEGHAVILVPVNSIGTVLPAGCTVYKYMKITHPVGEGVVTQGITSGKCRHIRSMGNT